MNKQVRGEPASRLARLIATGIDMVLVPSLSLLLIVVFGIVEHAEDFADYWWMLHVLLLAIFSYLLLNGYGLWRDGQTLGKRLLGIAIVKAEPEGDGSYQLAPLWNLVLLRAWFFPLMFTAIIPWFFIAPILDLSVIFGKQRRCVHDYLCGTAVVKLN